MKYRDIAWDFDGTLYNSYPFIVQCIRQSLEKFGYTDTEENIALYAHVTVGHALEHYAPLCGCEKADLLHWYRVFSAGTSSLTVPYEGIPELLRDITLAGGRNHICSNRSAARCKDYLDRDGLTPYFDVFAGPDAAPGIVAKPAPDLIRVILDARQIAPENLLMVGDRNLDIEAAHAAGSVGCFIDIDGFATVTCDPEFFAADVDELRKILLG